MHRQLDVQHIADRHVCTTQLTDVRSVVGLFAPNDDELISTVNSDEAVDVVNAKLGSNRGVRHDFVFQFSPRWSQRVPPATAARRSARSSDSIGRDCSAALPPPYYVSENTSRSGTSVIVPT